MQTFFNLMHRLQLNLLKNNQTFQSVFYLIMKI